MAFIWCFTIQISKDFFLRAGTDQLKSADDPRPYIALQDPVESGGEHPDGAVLPVQRQAHHPSLVPLHVRVRVHQPFYKFMNVYLARGTYMVSQK